MKFQCSSASRKFLNGRGVQASQHSADVSVLFSEPKIPQCSARHPYRSRTIGFSALQRAENSSIWLPIVSTPISLGVSVLFSEPKIPQCRCGVLFCDGVCLVSVLFSEPKIPQSSSGRRANAAKSEVSVLFSEPKIPQSGTLTGCITHS